MFKKLRTRENGDTIVEVLIALAILVLVLSGAYYTANQSYRNDRDSQEHSEALTIAQTELEDLRTFVDSGNTFTAACMQSAEMQTNSCYVNSNNTGATFSSTQNACLATGAPYCYDIIISEPTLGSPVKIDSNAVSVNTYEVQVNWPPIGGGNSDNVTLYYRLDT